MSLKHTGILRIATSADQYGVDGHGAQYDYVILQSWQQSHIAGLKAANPAIKVLAYKNLFMTNTSATAEQNSCGVLYSWADVNQPTWFLKSGGARIASYSYPSLYLMDVGLVAYQAKWATDVIAEMAARGFDGVFLDDCDNAESLVYHLNPGPRPVDQYPTDAGLDAAVDSFVAYVGPALTAAGLIAIPNVTLGGWWRDTSVAQYDRWLANMSGAFFEYYTKWGDASSLWHQDVTAAEDLAAGGAGFDHLSWSQRQVYPTRTSSSKIFLAHTYTPDGDVHSMRYARASLLLAWNGNPAALMRSPPAATPLVDPAADGSGWTAGFDIGVPVGASYAVGVAWAREYSLGWVAVNPSPTHSQVVNGVTIPATDAVIVSDPEESILSLTLAPVTPTLLGETITSVAPWSWYDVKAYGAKGDGVTNDRAAIQAAIDACITGGGGTVFMPAGEYMVSGGPLVFSAMAPGNKVSVCFKGAGMGATSQGDLWSPSTTRIINGNTGRLTEAKATNINNYIHGLWYEDFCTVNLNNIGAGVYTHYWDGVVGYSGMKRVSVVGKALSTSANAGNGIGILNPFNTGGATILENVLVFEFGGATSQGYYTGQVATDIFGAGVASGNVNATGCYAVDCTYGWVLVSMFGCTLTGCYSGRVNGSMGAAIGFELDYANSCTFNSCATEDIPGIGFRILGCVGNTFNSILTAGSDLVDSAGVVFSSSSKGNVLSGYIENFYNGATFDATSVGNDVSLYHNGTMSGPLFAGTTAAALGANSHWDMVTNVRTEAGAPIIASDVNGTAANKKVAIYAPDGSIAGYIKLYTG